MQRLYALYCLSLFTVLVLTTLAINLLLPGPRRRRRVAGVFSRLFLRAARIPFTVHGTDRLPQCPSVIVANHASYLDGIIAIAALPADFTFVIKREMVNVPLAGLFLRGLGSQFVDRFNPKERASDARRVLRTAASGQSLVFFPEGTFDDSRVIRRFMAGAFATAQRSGMPVVAVAIVGARDVLPPNRMMIYRRPIRVEILAVLEPAGARRRSRELIAAAVAEPMVPDDAD